MFTGRFLRRTIIATIVASSVLVAFWGVITWLPSFLATPVAKGGAGLTLTKSAQWSILLQIGAFFGYISFGWIADRIGRRTAFTLFMIVAAIVVPVFALEARSTLALLIVCPLVGFFCHGYFSMFGAMLSELFPTRIRASAQGFCYNVGRLASAAMPYIIGVAAATYGLGTLLAADAMFFALGGALVWLLPETKGVEL
jgi:sugar phosphate permease